MQLLAYNNQGKYRIIGTSIDFVNLRLIMNRVGMSFDITVVDTAQK